MMMKNNENNSDNNPAYKKYGYWFWRCVPGRDRSRPVLNQCA